MKTSKCDPDSIMIYGRDILQVEIAIEGYEAENGDWNEGTTGWGDPIPCDAKPNGQANTIALPDGNTYSYAYELTMAVDAPKIKFGTKVMLTRKGEDPEELTCKGWHRYAFQTKTWL